MLGWYLFSREKGDPEKGKGANWESTTKKDIKVGESQGESKKPIREKSCFVCRKPS